MNPVFDNAAALVQQEQLLPQEAVVVAAVSGGADSTALLLFLLEYQQKKPIQIVAAHINHGLRGAASDEDEAFVRRLCAQYGVQLFVKRLTPVRSDMSEEWARNERYAYLRQIARSSGALIAVAHTLDDQAETVLFHLVRGAFVHGAAGMLPRNAELIRPFLTTRGEQLRKYLTQQQQPWCEDETNATMQYTRGKIRHGVLCQLEEIHSGAACALARFAEQMREVSQWLEMCANALLKQSKLKQGVYCLRTFQAAAPSVQKEALRLLILSHAQSSEKAALCTQAFALVQRGSGALCISCGVRLMVSQQRLQIVCEQAASKRWSLPFALGEHTLIDGRQLSVSVYEKEKVEVFLKNQKKALKFLLDYDMIKDSTLFRTRHEGDFFSSAERKVTKLLRKWHSEQKVLVQHRDKRLVLAKDNEILWEEGLGVCRRCAVSDQTEKVAVIQVRPSKELQNS